MEYVVNILESFLGECRKHNEENGQASFDCPVCSAWNGMPDGDGKGNLEVNYFQDVYKCWVCKDTDNTHGSVTKLIKKYGTPKILADYRLLQPEKIFEKGETKVLFIPEGYKPLKDCTSKDFKYNRAMWYLLTKRGITPRMIEQFEIGYTTIGRFHNRIIIPSYTEDGDLNYFIARWFDQQYTKLDYINPDGSIVKKQDIIFGESRINWDATIYLVEGVFDYLVVPNSIPLLGKYISDVLLHALHNKAKANIVVFLDGDAYEDGVKLYNQLNFGNLHGRIRICRLPLFLDPSEIYKQWGPMGIVHYLKNPKKLKETMFS